jgi:hypothetical protein
VISWFLKFVFSNGSTCVPLRRGARVAALREARASELRAEKAEKELRKLQQEQEKQQRLQLPTSEEMGFPGVGLCTLNQVDP